MRKPLARGGLYGLGFLGVSYAVVYFHGYGKASLMTILYITLFACIWMEVKDHLDFPEINILHRIVLVSEEEKLKMRKVFTGEKYEISGNVQKVD
jgi:hypothetical protein